MKENIFSNNSLGVHYRHNLACKENLPEINDFPVRVKMVPVTMTVLVEIFKTNKDLRISVEGLPRDAKFCGFSVRGQFTKHPQLFIFVKSDYFENVFWGDLIPEITPFFTNLKQSEVSKDA